ncbi:MAG: hypothetical protein SFY80_04115 [Verrucomicrobiota bacterium]|nr:hypothetical protein [Verrucomicrobiota bacterium]
MRYFIEEYKIYFHLFEIHEYPEMQRFRNRMESHSGNGITLEVAIIAGYRALHFMTVVELAGKLGGIKATKYTIL